METGWFLYMMHHIFANVRIEKPFLINFFFQADPRFIWNRTLLEGLIEAKVVHFHYFVFLTLNGSINLFIINK